MKTDKRLSTGVANLCKSCAANESREWDNENPEHARQYSSTYYQLNRDAIIAATRRYELENADKVREQKKAYYRKNRDRLRAYAQQNYQANKTRYMRQAKNWKSRNPSKVNMYTSIRRARKVNLPATMSAADQKRCLDYWQYRCAFCNRPKGMFRGMELTWEHWISINDPRPNNPGTVPWNILPACGNCNYGKQDRDAYEFLLKKFGKRKAKVIVDKVLAYFAWVISQGNI